MTKNILVTGGAGFIGSHLVDRLLATSDAQITVIDNFNEFYDSSIKRNNVRSHLENSRYQLVEADIRDAARLGEIFDSNEFDLIVHLAALAGVRPSLEQADNYETTNVMGTLNLLELARAKEIKKFVFGSSSSVYGANKEAPFKEELTSLPISPYAATKAAGEMFAHTYSHLYDIKMVCLRFFTVYGPRQRPDLAIHKFARLMAAGQAIPLYGDGTTERDYTYVSDIVNGIVAAMEYDKTPYEAINLGCSQTVPLKYLVELLEAALGIQAKIEWLPMQPGDLERTHADVSKAARLLGYVPTTPIEVGIQKFAEWFKLNKQSGKSL